MEATGQERAHPVPRDQVVAIVDDSDALQGAVDALAGAGFATGDLEILCGPDGIRQIDADGRRHGLLSQLVRFVERLGGEQEHARRIEQELAQGHFAVGVRVGRDEQRKLAAARLLREHGGHLVYYYGPWTVEELSA